LRNVLGGDMSLGGPRPERGVFVEAFRKQIPDYTQRHQAQAGMTGWAQVQGWRGETSLRHRIRCDLYYISHWSLWLDLRILLLTIWGGMRHPNKLGGRRPEIGLKSRPDSPPDRLRHTADGAETPRFSREKGRQTVAAK